MNYIKILKYPFLLFVIVYFLYLVLSNAPAAWAAWGVHKAVPNLWLSSVDGSLWSGRARSAQVDIGPSRIALGEVKWTLNPFSLLILSPCVNFNTALPQQTISGQFCQSILGKTKVKNLIIDAPISAIAEMLPVKANGKVSLQINAAEFTRKPEVKKLDAQFRWTGARAYLADTWLTFGSLSVAARENGSGGITGKLTDVDSPYTLDINADWMAATGWKFGGNVTPGSTVPSNVVEGLQIIGEDIGSGVFKIQWPL